ncbi:MAG: DEAD/DEAH box helicase [Candidatus Caldatribacteriota bacterium]|nr:DEAD/DEAH box helicase [Candidatus Caldatribacteriota bacterium]
MKMRNLENYGIHSSMVDIWENNYSDELMPVQEEAVRDYGVLDYEENARLPRRYASHNDNHPQGRGINRNNLLVVAPTSSGKTFIGEMAAVTQAINNKKTIYLVPLRTLAEEKYRRFKKMYYFCGIDVVISSRDRKEDDKRIGSGRFGIAIMIYEKFHYFMLKYPEFLSGVTLVIIDELQIINDPVRGPLLEEILVYIQKQEQEVKTICLSAFLENQRDFLKWFPCRVLTSYKRPVELRKGIIREGVFKYITHNERKVGEEVFFHRLAVRDNCREDYMLKTVKYFVERNEPTLLFFPTRAECKKWALWLADNLDANLAEKALEDLRHMEETLTRDNLLSLLEKGIAYHNSDLSWEERNLVENYLQSGEIKVVCATTTLAMGVNLPFKNVILSINKIESVTGDSKDARLTSLTFTDIENMGGRAGRLNTGKEEEFGRVIFIAHSLLSECIYKNLYFNFLRDGREKGKVAEEIIPYPETGDVDGVRVIAGPRKREKDLDTLLLRLTVGGKDSVDAILSAINEGNFKDASSASLSEREDHHGYWQFVIDKKRCREKIGDSLERLKKNRLITEDDRGIFSVTDAGTLIIAKGIKVDTYLYFLSRLKGSIKGELSPLQIIFTLTLSEDGKALPIPYPQFYRKGYKEVRFRHTDWKEIYRNKLLGLVFELGEEGKEVFCKEVHGLQKGKTSVDDYLAFKKTLLLHDWIGSREIRSIEQEYSLYRGAVKRLGEGFSWLADCLAVIAEGAGWKKEREEDLKKIKCLSGRMVEGVEEEGLMLARLHIPGLTRSYIRRLLKEGYDNEDCLKEVGEDGLGKVLPGRLVKRIKERIKEEKKEEKRKEKERQEQESKKEKEKESVESYQGKSASCNSHIVLEIDKRRPDRIIFEGKNIKVTAKEFSLIYLLVQHTEQVMSYEEVLDELWGKEEEVIYSRVNYHFSKIKNTILKTIGKNKINEEKVKDVFKVISRRGIMLNLEEDELKLN